jgi:hypothetical protein
MNVLNLARYWLLDYLFLAKTNMAATIRRETPDTYRRQCHYPIVVIPGIYENWRFMRPITKLLYQHEYDVHVITGLGYNRANIEDSAAKIEAYISENGLGSVSIVSHSKGGLIGKYLLASSRLSIDALVALNAPFAGSRYAYLFLFGPLKIFSPRSKILKLLSLDTLSNRKIVSIYGQFDPHIPEGSKLEGAVNIQLPTYGHFRTIGDPKVQHAILEALKPLHPTLK